jgi:hypothetical protein
MNLPGRLRSTTLGDLLGRLHRAGASGILELVEPSGASAGRAHRIFLREGRVDDVHTDLGAAAFAPGLSAQIRHKLEQLFRFSEALIRFHVRRPTPAIETERPVLGPEDFLHGRPRARARRPETSRSEAPPLSAESVRARRILGLTLDADVQAARSAFRRLASEVHPDRHPSAPPEERARLLRRFAELSSAYHTLAG